MDRPTLNARDFPTIQAALERLPDAGGTVVVPAGVHAVAEKIRLRSNVELRGEGIDRTTLVLADGVRDHLLANAHTVEGNTGIVIRDLRLRGNRAGQRKWSHGDRLVQARADEVWSFGVRLVNVTDSLVENVEASDFAKDGFYLGYNRYNGVYRTRLVGCRARNNGRNGISLTHGSYNVVERCVVEDNNLVERVGGIQLEPDEDLEVSHNLIVGNRAAGNHTGVTLYTEPPSWRGVSTLVGNAVCYNRAERNDFVGIWDHFGQGNVFVGNTATGSRNDFGEAETSLVGEAFAGGCVPPVDARGGRAP
jgi:parallel beta-helix repeat protein